MPEPGQKGAAGKTISETALALCCSHFPPTDVPGSTGGVNHLAVCENPAVWSIASST